MSSNVWKEIGLESGEELMKDQRVVENYVTSVPEDHMVNSVDCDRDFITDEMIDLQNKTCKSMR